MNPQSIQQLQTSLGLPATGVLDNQTITAMNDAVAKAVKSNKDVQKYAGVNGVDAVLNAYMTGNWSGVVDLTGKPFTKEQQAAAVAEAEKVLAPAYRAAESFDRSVVEDALKGEQDAFGQFQEQEKKDFGVTKDALDEAAVDQGVLFSGSRVQKLNDLRNTYADRERIARSQAASGIRSAARAHQYEYGDEAAGALSDLYRFPSSSTFNPNVVGGRVTPNSSLSSVYNPKEFKFQGTKPVAQKAAVQTRAATQLANRANKLSMSGIGTKF